MIFDASFIKFFIVCFGHQTGSDQAWYRFGWLAVMGGLSIAPVSEIIKNMSSVHNDKGLVFFVYITY